VAASNNRDHEITLVSPLVSTINCSLTLASQALLEATRLDHSIGITLLLLVCATYIWVLFFTYIPFVRNCTECNTNREVATPL